MTSWKSISNVTKNRYFLKKLYRPNTKLNYSFPLSSTPSSKKKLRQKARTFDVNQLVGRSGQMGCLICQADSEINGERKRTLFVKLSYFKEKEGSSFYLFLYFGHFINQNLF